MMRWQTGLRTSSRTAVVVVAILAGALAVTPSQPVRAASCSAVTLPSYFYPGSLWDSATQAPGSVRRTLILNPDSGPGTQPDPNYVSAVASARTAGATVVGYVHTSYGNRPQEDVLADVQAYRQFYDVTHVFLDEVSSTAAELPYYGNISTAVRSAGGLVLLNPGTHPDERYMALGDQVVTFEGTYDTYRRAQIPSWTANHPPHKFTHLVYATAGRNMSNAISLAGKRKAGNVYVTDDGGANPWDTLPSYWSDELDRLAGSC